MILFRLAQNFFNKIIFEHINASSFICHNRLLMVSNIERKIFPQTADPNKLSACWSYSSEIILVRLEAFFNLNFIAIGHRPIPSIGELSSTTNIDKTTAKDEDGKVLSWLSICVNVSVVQLSVVWYVCARMCKIQTQINAYCWLLIKPLNGSKGERERKVENQI